MEEPQSFFTKDTSTSRSNWLIRNKWLIVLAAILILMIIASVATLAVLGLMVSPWLAMPCALLFATLLTASWIFYSELNFKKIISQETEIYRKLPLSEDELTIEQNKPLGQGAFVVYCGKYRGGTVAIKKMATAKTNEFNREVNIMARLDSPYIVRFFAASMQKKIIVMEYVGGGDLGKLLTSENCPAWGEGRYQIGLDIAYGLKYLHGCNIIHGDLKPQNILITTDLRAKIADFGLSKIAKNALTDSTQFLYHDTNSGTPCFAAPEVCSGPSVDNMSKCSDMFSYGSVLWTLGSKKLPFESDSAYTVILNTVNGKRETVTEDTPLKMAESIRLCWFHEPAKRPTIEAVTKTLEEESISYGCQPN